MVKTELTSEEKKEIIRCMEWDIKEVNAELKLIKYSLDLIKKDKTLTQNDIHRIIKSLNYDIQSRVGTKSFEDNGTKLMLGIIHKLKSNIINVPKNLLPETMIEGRIK